MRSEKTCVNTERAAAVKDDAEGEVRQVKEFDRLEAIFLTGITIILRIAMAAGNR